MKRLKSYLNKIAAEQPINLTKFYNLIDTLELSPPRKPEHVDACFVKGMQYSVTRIDKTLLQQLETIAHVDCESRVAASLQNNSHTAKVTGSFLIIRSGQAMPEIVLIDQQGEFSGAQTDIEQALIIENKQNFIDADKTAAFLEGGC